MAAASAIIEVRNVSKEFRLGRARSFRDSARNAMLRLSGKPVPRPMPFKALDQVDFSVAQGEVVGIIGHNGAGKSTLLKILAGISLPTRGAVSVHGKVAPLIEVGAGLVPDLSGRENIYLNATILGMRREDIRRKFDEIVDFAELQGFIDTPIKRFSSGMQVRLGFAIATAVEAPILIVDEVLAVGDLAFQRKCFDRMEHLIKRQGRTVLLVSHNLRQIQRLCNRVISLKQGRIHDMGSPQAVCDRFYEESDAKIHASASSALARTRSSGEMDLLEVSFHSRDGRTFSRLEFEADCVISFRIRVHQKLDTLTFGFGVHTTDFLYLTTHNSETQLAVEELEPGEHEIKCLVRKLPLLPGVYSLRFGVTAGQAARTVFYGENLKHFQVVGSVPITVREGFFALDAGWNVDTRQEALPLAAAARRP